MEIILKTYTTSSPAKSYFCLTLMTFVLESLLPCNEQMKAVRQEIEKDRERKLTHQSGGRLRVLSKSSLFRRRPLSKPRDKLNQLQPN